MVSRGVQMTNSRLTSVFIDTARNVGCDIASGGVDHLSRFADVETASAVDCLPCSFLSPHLLMKPPQPPALRPPHSVSVVTEQ
ncbi:hypothetical protein L1887_25270 [Cichorium endivia]|nr:hypothetical protein L1887_25270 [Cichorium endivia]